MKYIGKIIAIGGGRYRKDGTRGVEVFLPLVPEDIVEEIGMMELCEITITPIKREITQSEREWCKLDYEDYNPSRLKDVKG